MWKKIIIDNYETNYSVSDEGQVKNDLNNVLLKPSIQQGYAHVTLYINGKYKRCKVHRLVAIAFIPNPECKPYVNHIDGLKNHNVVNNLEWVTPAENTQHAVRTGLMLPTREHKVTQFSLEGDKIAEFASMSEAARATNSLVEKICMCCERKRITHNGFQWRYSNECGERLQKVMLPKTMPKQVAQINITTNQIIAVYESITQAAKAVNGSSGAICNIINHKTQTYTHKGYKWKLLEDIVQ